MNSLTVCSLFLFLPAFLVCASNYNVYILKTPYNFKFKVNDVLNIDIAMINIPPNVYYFSVNTGEKSVINKFEISRWDIWHITIDTIATQNSYHSIKLLLYEKSDSNYACTTVNIAQGQPKNSLRSISEQNETDDCLNDKHCTITVDFRNSCTKTVPYFKCSLIDPLVMCTKQEYNEDTFTWQQFYDDGSYIGTTPEIKATISKFIYTLQNFDNNTFVKALPGNSRSNTFKMNPVIPEYKTESKLTFTDSTNIEFDCEIYLQQTKYVYVGLINTTENKITTLNTTKINKKYGAEYNGSILCCLYYTTQKISEKIPEINVIRHVQDTTLLLYSTEALEPLPYLNCSFIDPLVVCTKQEYKEDTFTWQQFYDDGSYIGTTPEIKATISKFIYTLQNFDNNTFVKALPGNSRSITFKMNPVIPEYKTESKLTFTDSTNIEFDCDIYLQQTKYVYVGLINTTENKITTLNTTKINKKYGAEYNGSILCCLYYTTQKISEKIPEINVIRHVQDTTLLLYSTEALDPLPYLNCSFIDPLVVCTKQEYKEDTFTWQQFYDDGSYIGTTPEIKATISKFIYTLQNFDNNTFVKALPGNSRSNTFKMNPVIPEYKTESKLTFTDSTNIEFDCEIYLQQTNYVYVGLINTTENKITTLNTTNINNKHGAEYNGSILCCLYYTTQKISEKLPEINVIRHVQDSTLLLYSTEALEPLPYLNCSFIDPLVVCTKQEYKEDTFTWQQFYDDGSYIGTTPEIKATISKFIFTVEYFDNNTFVKALPGNSRSNTFQMNPVIPEYKTESKLTFTDSTNIEFDCEIYLQQTNYVYVGLINTTENKITTLNTTNINNKYGAEYNGSILCCLYSTTQKISEKLPEINVIRHVQDMTLLLYSTEALADSGVTRNLTVLYTSVTAAVLILAVAIIIVVIICCCNKTPTSSEPKPVSKWEPFYVNKLLLLRKECDKEIEAERQAQEPVYEEIL